MSGRTYPSLASLGSDSKGGSTSLCPPIYYERMRTADELLRSVAHSDDSAYLLDPAFNLIRVNAGFVRFAGENGGANLLGNWQGKCVLEAIPPILRGFYAAGFERARTKGTPWEHDYECSSAEVYRSFRMIVYPVPSKALFVIHSLRVESPHARAVHPPDVQTYLRDGFIHMCANCRRVENPHGSERWDWVPVWLDQAPDNVSHGLCKPCAVFYWYRPPSDPPA